MLPVHYIEGAVAEALDTAHRGGRGELGEDFDSRTVGGLITKQLSKVIWTFVTHELVTNLKMER